MSKKRKTREDDNTAVASSSKKQLTQSKISISAQPAREIGPALVNYPALEPQGSTPFTCYATGGDRDEEDDNGPAFYDRPTLLVAENKEVQFITDPLQTAAAKAHLGSRYLIAIHNSRTNTTLFRPAPLHLISRTIKAHAALAIPNVPNVPLQYNEARTALGQSFGTKKAQAALRAAERNKVDVSAMKDVVGYLQKGIERGTEGLPTQDQAAETAASARQIPPLNEDAITPDDVYPLHSVIPQLEWDAINVSDMLDPNISLTQRMRCLPNARSDWVGNGVKREFKEGGGKVKKKTLKTIYYVAALLLFRRVTSGGKDVDRESISQKMGNVPSLVVDGMIDRFLESPRTGSTYKATKDKQNLLITYMFALCLKVDQNATDTAVLSRDLALSPTSVVTLFKSLGCRIVKLSEPQRLKLGIAASDADVKRAQLTCPPTFPKQRVQRKAGGRG